VSSIVSHWHRTALFRADGRKKGGLSTLEIKDRWDYNANEEANEAVSTKVWWAIYTSIDEV